MYYNRIIRIPETEHHSQLDLRVALPFKLLHSGPDGVPEQ